MPQSLKTFIIAFLLLALGSTQIDGVTLHTILIGDTLAENIGLSVQKDLEHMQKEVDLITKYTQLPAKEHVICGDLVTGEIFSQIEAMPIEEEDIILFFFSGHGYRELSKENSWPNLYFTPEDLGVDFAEIHRILSEKKPRFLLAMVDCCNEQIPDLFAPFLMQVKAQTVTDREVLERNYQHLFLDHMGEIFASSSSAGEFSFCDEIHGGYFTYFFLKELHHAVCSEEIQEWETIFSNVRKKLASLSFYEAGETQTPQFQIDLF